MLFARAISINSLGQAVGEVLSTKDVSDALLWQNGTVTVLGTLPGFKGGSATGINDLGQVAGFNYGPSTTPEPSSLALWLLLSLSGGLWFAVKRWQSGKAPLGW